MNGNIAVKAKHNNCIFTHNTDNDEVFLIRADPVSQTLTPLASFGTLTSLSSTYNYVGVTFWINTDYMPVS